MPTGDDNKWFDDYAPGGWWGINEIPQLTNTNRLPIMCVAACSTAEFATLPPYGAYVDKDGLNHVGSNSGEIFTSTPPPPSCLQTWFSNTNGADEGAHPWAGHAAGEAALARDQGTAG